MRRIPLLLLFIGLCMLVLSACDVPNGDGSYTSIDQTSSQPNSQSSSGSIDYRSLARQDAINAGISADYYERQINQESGFNPYAVSSAGAIGIAQIEPSTATSWRVDPHNPIASLNVAAQHMAWYQNTYGSYEKALACYNAGCGSLLYAESHCSDFYWCLPEQTRNYITDITGYI